MSIDKILTEIFFKISNHSRKVFDNADEFTSGMIYMINNKNIFPDVKLMRVDNQYFSTDEQLTYLKKFGKKKPKLIIVEIFFNTIYFYPDDTIFHTETRNPDYNFSISCSHPQISEIMRHLGMLQFFDPLVSHLSNQHDIIANLV